MADDERDPLSWIARFLATLPADAGFAEAVSIDEGARWRVEETGPGSFAVLREGEEESAAPDAVFDDRRTAYAAAAVFTAFGGPPDWTEEEEGGRLLEAWEVREPAAGDFDEAMAARLLAGLVRNPAALELLLEAAEPGVLEKARAEVVARMIERTGGKVH